MRRRHLAPVLLLAPLTPFVAEFLLGDQWLAADHGLTAQLAMFVVVGTWYGACAVLIREITRRTDRGWPTILMLGLAFGLIEEGVLTQSLFNPHYLGLDLLSYGHLETLGIAVPWTLFVLTLHVVWSIATPIALVEGIWPDRDPWLGRVGLGVTIAVALLGGLAIFVVSRANGGFLAAPGQLAGSVVLAGFAITVALRLPRVAHPRAAGPIPSAAVVATVLASAFQVLDQVSPAHLPAGLSVALSMILLIAAVEAATAWRLDVLGLAVGPVLTYAWIGLANAAAHGPAALIEQGVIVAVALAVAGIGLRKHGLHPDTSAPDRLVSPQTRS